MKLIDKNCYLDCFKFQFLEDNFVNMKMIFKPIQIGQNIYIKIQSSILSINDNSARKYADKDEIYIDTYAYDIKKLENSYNSDHP